MTMLTLERPRTTDRLVAGRYRLLSLLGRGGMGRVWLAADEVLGRRVAVKQVLSEGVAWSEARALARIDHPAVVRVHDFVEEGGCQYIVMELLTGTTLCGAMNGDRLSVPVVAKITRELLDALAAVHAAGLVHGDLKPSNVQLCDDGRVVLTDFGIAAEADQTLTAETMAGSPAYIAPERARGDRVGPAADLFSLGATLYAAVEGRPPFGSGDPFHTLCAVVHELPAPFVHAGPLVPVIDGLLAKTPEVRLTMAQARRLLQQM